MSEADGSWKVQASFKSHSGALLNVRGLTPEEVAGLIEAAKGQENFSEFFPGAAPAQPALAIVPEVDAEAVERAEAILSQQTAPAVVETAAPVGQFDMCEYCNIPKDQWKPPGVSGSGKKYPGFFGCPNWKNHPKR